MSTINDTQLIELYCNKQLTPSAQKEVEKRLLTDVEFSTHYKQFISLTEGIEELGRKETQSYLNELEKQLPKVTLPKKRILHKRTWIAVAASIFLALSFQFYTSNQYTGIDIYNEYHKSYPLLSNHTTRGEASLKHYDAYSAYEAEKYIDAIQLFDDTDEIDRFYKANALLENHQTKEALQYFQHIEITSQVFDTQASWYIALCYLSMDKRDKAILQLQQILASNNSYSNKAKEILMKLQ